MAIALRYAARSDVGLVRSNNQDSGYAGPHLLVVADGMGGHAGGDVASSLAIGELAPLDGESHGADDALDQLARAIESAHQRLLERVTEEPELTGMGTTVSALLRSGNRFAVAHIGDSRTYLLRDGVLTQLTRDHSFVQTLVDQGRLTREEAEHHPRRSVLMRVLSDLVEDAEPDLSVREARPGERYLLCTDGLSGVVSFETLQETLAQGLDPAGTCEQLVQFALRGGAPDNVTCVVADVIEAGPDADNVPVVVGAAANRQPPRPQPLSQGSSAERAAALTATVQDPPAAPGQDRPRTWLLRRGLVVLGLLLLAGAGALGAWRWSQDQYFVSTADGVVAVYRGLSQDVGPLELATVQSVADDVPVEDLPSYSRKLLSEGILADNERSAQGIVTRLREQAQACRAARKPTPSPTPTGPQDTRRPAGTRTSPGGDGGSATARTPGATAPATTMPSPDAQDPLPGESPSSPVSAEDCGGIG